MGKVLTTSPGALSTKVVDAKRPLTISVIRSRHHRRAVCRDGSSCVVAKAIKDSNLGEYIEHIEVGLTITKITIAGVIHRYVTPSKLRPPIREFDRTSVWVIPDGEYVFQVPTATTGALGSRPGRLPWVRRENTDGTGQDTMVQRAVPTRRIKVNRS